MIYSITIKDETFGELTGEFNGCDQTEAEAEAKEFYAADLGMFPQDIVIVNTVIK